MLGWYILFMKPIDGDLKGYFSGKSTLTFHTPPSYEAARMRTCVKLVYV